MWDLRLKEPSLMNLQKYLIVDYEINGKKSLDRAKYSVAHLARHFEGYRANDITTDKIKRYIAERQKEEAENGTINRELSALKRMFILAINTHRVRSIKYPISLCSKKGM